jgi:hypothetical protein
MSFRHADLLSLGLHGLAEELFVAVAEGDRAARSTRSCLFLELIEALGELLDLSTA